MNGSVLLDAGPLVAFLSARDAYHEWATEQWRTLTPPMLTCEAVLAEAVFLLRREDRRVQSVLELVKRGVVRLDFVLGHELDAVHALLRRYEDAPMSLADACLVRMSELHAESRVFTVDRHFRLYRRHGRQVIPLLAPW